MLLVKWLVLPALVLGVAGGAAAYAFGGSTLSGPVAYALVDPNGGSPRLIADHTSGFSTVSVGAAGQGDYCLTPGRGVDVVQPAAVASEEAFYSNAAGFVTVRYQPNTPNCAPGRLEVKTFDQNVALSNQIAFTVNVPE
jgi:hypothetical protein